MVERADTGMNEREFLVVSDFDSQHGGNPAARKVD